MSDIGAEFERARNLFSRKRLLANIKNAN